MNEVSNVDTCYLILVTSHVIVWVMVVRMRANRSKTGMRRSHAALSAGRLATCECGANRVPHRACPACGKYNGRIVVDVVARAKREQKRTARRTKNLRESGQLTSEKETTST